MPLVKSGSNKAREKNIEEMIHSGHKPEQAEAAAYSNQRKFKHRIKIKKEHFK